jgi:hypothetical protein
LVFIPKLNAVVSSRAFDPTGTNSVSVASMSNRDGSITFASISAFSVHQLVHYKAALETQLEKVKRALLRTNNSKAAEGTLLRQAQPEKRMVPRGPTDGFDAARSHSGGGLGGARRLGVAPFPAAEAPMSGSRSPRRGVSPVAIPHAGHDGYASAGGFHSYQSSPTATASARQISFGDREASKGRPYHLHANMTLPSSTRLPLSPPRANALEDNRGGRTLPSQAVREEEAVQVHLPGITVARTDANPTKPSAATTAAGMVPANPSARLAASTSSSELVGLQVDPSAASASSAIPSPVGGTGTRTLRVNVNQGSSSSIDVRADSVSSREGSPRRESATADSSAALRAVPGSEGTGALSGASVPSSSSTASAAVTTAPPARLPGRAGQNPKPSSRSPMHQQADIANTTRT